MNALEEPMHIMPTDDILEHSETATCDCEPVIMINPNGNQIVHNAYGGREHLEPGHMRFDCKF